MKKVNLGLIFLASFSLFIMIYLNSVSTAQDVQIPKVEGNVYSQLDEKDTATVIVYLRDNLNEKDLNNIDKISKISRENINEVVNSVKSGNFELVYEYTAFNAFAAKVDRESLAYLESNPMVREIYAEDILSIQLQQSLPLINATQAWNVPVNSMVNLTGVGQTVCVLDTGVDYMNPALGGAWGTKIIGGYDFVNSDSDPRDDNGHGTHVTGIIAANGMANSTTLIKGVAPDATIYAEKVCNATGSCSNANMLAGINHCLTSVNPGKLASVSISIGNSASYNSSTCPTWMDSAINTSVNNGVPVIVASGNQGFKNGISYPACSPNAISVGMTYDSNVGAMPFSGVCIDFTTWADKVACATNSGPNLDLMAPGSRITSVASSIGTVCGAGNGGVGTCSGTSMAAPHVAGAAALIKQKYGRSLYGVNGAKKIDVFLKRSNVMVTDPGNLLSFPRLSLESLL